MRDRAGAGPAEGILHGFGQWLSRVSERPHSQKRHHKAYFEVGSFQHMKRKGEA